MKKYNCIVLFNEDKTKILFCKRKKNPYKGLYNFVGGKVESGESSMNAAYRELNEETGISPSQVRLYRLMDITYYNSNFILELYVGKLSETVALTEEINPLIWLPVTKNFADTHRFAGDQNIAHIVNVALQYPLEQQQRICIGVDGCKGGWITAVIDSGKLEIERFSLISEITDRYPAFDGFLIDMPIGLPGSIKHIRPDSAVRKMLTGRASTVFNTPCRASVYSDTVAEMYENNRIYLGKNLQPPTKAIIPKIREVDEFVCGHAEYKNKIIESHPEVCFARLNGTVVMSSKADDEGITERINILQKHLPNLSVYDIKQKSREFKCNEDDIVDAICLAVTAQLYALGETEVIPSNPDIDDCGLKMQMVIPKR